MAVEAPEVTADRGNGEGLRAREAVEQGLLFYGIHVPGTGFPVDQGIESASPVLPDITDTPFTIAYNAVVPAKATVYLAVVTSVVEGGFFHDGPFSQAGVVFSVAAR